MKYSFHPEAESEFENAIDYYEEKEQGLGYDFAVERSIRPLKELLLTQRHGQLSKKI